MSLDMTPDWLDILRAPGSGAPLRYEGNLLLGEHRNEIGRVESGVVRFPTLSDDPNIKFYRDIGGAHFHERAKVPFAMSALDTPIYHELLREVTPQAKDAVIVDIGGGDGRNARPWLEQGFQRVVVIDAAAEALVRFRERIANEAPQWLERLLLIEADARALPLADGCATTVVAVEALYYLNEDYEIGLSEAVRILASEGALLLSERDYEAGIVTSLLYEGPAEMLRSASSHFVRDGAAETRVRTRSFTEAELVAVVEARGLRVTSVRGTSLIPLLLGRMRQQDAIGDDDRALLPEIIEMLRELARSGKLRRCHVVTARRR